MSGLADLDTRLFVLLNQEWTCRLLDVVMPWLSDFDHWRLPLVVVLLVFLARGRTPVRLGILFAILAVAAADQAVSSGLKPLFARERPFRVVEGTRQLLGAHGFAFPSAHAANVFAAGTFLAVRFRRWWPALFVALAVAYSRVYVGVHYPSDVAAGALVGAAIGGVAAAIERATRLRRERRSGRARGGGTRPPPGEGAAG